MLNASTQLEEHDDPCCCPACYRSAPQGFDQYGIGAFSAVPTPALQAALGLKAGVVTSGNSLDYTAEDMANMQRSEAAVKVRRRRGRVAWRGGMVFCWQGGKEKQFRQQA